MSNEKKKIIINKNYLTTSKSKKKKPKLNNLLKGTSMKNKLINEVKKHHKKTLKNTFSNNLKKNSNKKIDVNSLDDSISYLEELLKKRKKQKTETEKKKELENFKFTQNVESSIIKPVNTETLQITKPEILPLVKNENNNFNINSNTINTSQPKINVKPQPPYGILKKGKKPTYRQYHNISIKKPNTPKSHQSIGLNKHNLPKLNIPTSSSVSSTERKEKLNNYIQSYNKINNKKIKKKRKTMLIKEKKITKTRKLGKNKKNNKIGILIKNQKTNKNIKKEKDSLQKIPIEKIKFYLKKHGLLKSGSNAPEIVIRRIFEDAILSGDIYNLSDDTLLHNYLHT